MKRYTSRNSFNPHGRHGMNTPVGGRRSPRNLRSILRNSIDFLHDHLFVSILILALCIFAAWYTLSRRQTTTNSGTGSSSSDSSNAPILEKGKPDYDTIVPKGRTSASVDWTRIGPPDHNSVYTYVDTVGTTTIKVSEQPLPDNFKDNPDKSVEELASNSNATQKLTVGTTTVYLGTSEKGPQSAFFYKRNILVLIKTDTGLTTDQWMSYISSLQ